MKGQLSGVCGVMKEVSVLAEAASSPVRMANTMRILPSAHALPQQRSYS
jgi:hypothetical protein